MPCFSSAIKHDGANNPITAPESRSSIQRYILLINPFILPEWMMKSCIFNFGVSKIDKILSCDHSNETSLTVLSRGTICFSAFYKTKFC